MTPRYPSQDQVEEAYSIGQSYIRTGGTAPFYWTHKERVVTAILVGLALQYFPIKHLFTWLEAEGFKSQDGLTVNEKGTEVKRISPSLGTKVTVCLLWHSGGTLAEYKKKREYHPEVESHIEGEGHTYSFNVPFVSPKGKDLESWFNGDED